MGPKMSQFQSQSTQPQTSKSSPASTPAKPVGATAATLERVSTLDDLEAMQLLATGQQPKVVPKLKRASTLGEFETKQLLAELGEAEDGFLLPENSGTDS